VEVYEFTASTPVPNAGTAASARIYGTDYVRQGLAAGAVRFYWVRAVDASGNKSAWAGGTSATASAVDIPAASITSTQIADDSISTPKLQANSITAAKVGTNEIIATSANIANGVITTAKIADAAITTAKIGDAQINTAKIGDLQVSTLKIADNAVTLLVSAYTEAVVVGYYNTTGWKTVQTATITSSGGTIEIKLSYKHFGHSESYQMPCRFKRGSTVLYDDNLQMGATYGNRLTQIHILAETLAAGTYTYTLEAEMMPTEHFGNEFQGFSHRLISLFEAKK
jgi:hypothetical protein